jgi:hypothetical protein
MGQNALVANQVSDAQTLIKKLDIAGTPPKVAMWYFYDDVEQWRLILAIPELDALLPKQEAVAYQRVAKVVTSLTLTSLALSDIKLVRTDFALVKAIQILMRTPPTALVVAHFSDTTLNGIFMKEMIILRSA